MYDLFQHMLDADGIGVLHGLDKELAHMDVSLGRMLHWADIDSYYLQKFITGRSFKNHGYYNSVLEDFYRCIFNAYPEELRKGRVAYDPQIHNVETLLYEGQLARLKELAEDERHNENNE